MSVDPTFRAAYEKSDCEIIELEGLIDALDTLIGQCPGLGGPDRETGALRATFNAIRRQMIVVAEAQDSMWKKMGGGA